jgi:hypothetical protein
VYPFRLEKLKRETVRYAFKVLRIGLLLPRWHFPLLRVMGPGPLFKLEALAGE